jgi:hypothetical protein
VGVSLMLKMGSMWRGCHTAQHSTAQHSTAQHSTAHGRRSRHGPAQHSQALTAQYMHRSPLPVLWLPHLVQLRHRSTRKGCHITSTQDGIVHATGACQTLGGHGLAGTRGACSNKGGQKNVASLRRDMSDTGVCCASWCLQYVLSLADHERTDTQGKGRGLVNKQSGKHGQTTQ